MKGMTAFFDVASCEEAQLIVIIIIREDPLEATRYLINVIADSPVIVTLADCESTGALRGGGGGS